MSKTRTEMTRFSLVGAVNFVLTFVLFYGLLNICNLNYLLSLTVAWIVGVTFTYVFNHEWVFRPGGNLQFRRRYIRYLLANATSFGLNIVFLFAMVEGMKWDPFLSQVALIPFIVIFNFLSAKYWSLKSAGST